MGKRTLKPAVFLDRDGVVNEAIVRDGKPFPPASLAELRITAGASETLARLRNADFHLVIVTNQPDVARGTTNRATVEAIHDRLRKQLPIDSVYSCFHDDRAACNCRKPRPGLLLEAARAEQLDLPASYLIGDRWRDIDAGWAAGVAPIFIDFGYDERLPSKPPAATVASLKVAVDWIMNTLS